MKKPISILIVSLFILTNTSCNKEKVNDSTLGNSKDEVVELTVEFISPVNDKFLLFYTVNPDAVLTDKYALKNYTYGSPEMQKTVFKFPPGALPYKIRLDVGENQSVESLIIKNISIKYKNKVIDGDYGNFMKYWGSNESIKFNEETLRFDIIQINGIKDPLFISNPDLDRELKNLYQ